MVCALTALVYIGLWPLFAQEGVVSVDQLTSLEGLRSNQLLGLGILSGLDGQGDGARSVPIKNALTSLLGHFSISVDPDEVQAKNSALVVVSADIPPYAREGDRIDVTVSSLFQAKNVRSGLLLQTPLQAADGTVYAVAQGKVETSEESATVGDVPGGAIMEASLDPPDERERSFSLRLKRPDYRTAYRIVEAIREAFPGLELRVRGAKLIECSFQEGDFLEILTSVGALKIDPPIRDVVLVNEERGIILMGGAVRIAPVSINWRGAKIETGPGFRDEGQRNSLSLQDYTRVEDFYAVLQDAGISSDDIIEIMKVIDRAGALMGRLEFM